MQDQIHAIVVALETSQLGPYYTIKGVANQAKKFIVWLRSLEIPRENISHFITGGEDNEIIKKEITKKLEFHGVDLKEEVDWLSSNNNVTMDTFLETINKKFEKSGKFLFVLWVGHGETSIKQNRYIHYYNSTTKHPRCLHLDSFVKYLNSKDNRFEETLAFVDACANSINPKRDSIISNDVGIWKNVEAGTNRLSVVYTAEKGFTAQNHKFLPIFVDVVTKENPPFSAEKICQYIEEKRVQQKLPKPKIIDEGQIVIYTDPKLFWYRRSSYILLFFLSLLFLFIIAIGISHVIPPKPIIMIGTTKIYNLQRGLDLLDDQQSKINMCYRFIATGRRKSKNKEIWNKIESHIDQIKYKKNEDEEAHQQLEKSITELYKLQYFLNCHKSESDCKCNGDQCKYKSKSLSKLDKKYLAKVLRAVEEILLEFKGDK